MAHPRLRSLDVLEDGDGTAHLGGGLAYPLDHADVGFVVAVAEVEPGDVHPGVHQAPDRLQVGHRRAHRGHDLRPAPHGPTL